MMYKTTVNTISTLIMFLIYYTLYFGINPDNLFINYIYIYILYCMVKICSGYVTCVGIYWRTLC